MNRRLVRWAPAALLGLFAVLVLLEMRAASITGDEVAHLPAGYTYVRTGDLRLNPQHPPLMKALAAAPLLWLDLKPVAGSPGWSAANEWEFGRDFLLRNRVSAERMVFLGRLPMLAVALVLGAVLFGWSRELWGDAPALLVLTLYVLCPNVLAHAPLVTTDMGVTAFTVVTLWALWRSHRRRSYGWAAVGGIGLGLALLAKYSAVVTAAAVAALLVLSAIESDPRDRLRRLATNAALVVAPAVLIVALGFGWPSYVHGFRQIHADLNPHWEGFLNGRYARSGFWDYYLFAQLWKTPLPTLLLFGAGLTGVRVRTREERVDWAFVLVPFLAFHLAGAAFHSSIGVRHILPAYPFLFLTAGAAVRGLEARTPGTKAALAFALAWLAFGTLRMTPHFLPYFNELAGGPAGGIRYLDDSNVEWGQDLGNLGRYRHEHPEARARLFAMEPLPPAHYGIDASSMHLRDLVWPEEDVDYFVGASYLQRNSLYDEYPGVRFQWLSRYRPVDTIGGSILHYRFSLREADAGRTGVVFLSRTAWYETAIRDLEAMVARFPGFLEARQLLADVHTSRGAWEESRGEVEPAALDYLSASEAAPRHDASHVAYRSLLPRFTSALTAATAGEDCSRPRRRPALGPLGERVRDDLRCGRRDASDGSVHADLARLYATMGFPALAEAELRAAASSGAP